jgi:hypothetical protein
MFMDKLCGNRCDCHQGFVVYHVSMHNGSNFVFLVQVGAIDNHYVPDEHLSSSAAVQALY